MTSIFEGQPHKTRPFPTKTRVIWLQINKIRTLAGCEWKTHPVPKTPNLMPVASLRDQKSHLLPFKYPGLKICLAFSGIGLQIIIEVASCPNTVTVGFCRLIKGPYSNSMISLFSLWTTVERHAIRFNPHPIPTLLQELQKKDFFCRQIHGCLFSGKQKMEMNRESFFESNSFEFLHFREKKTQPVKKKYVLRADDDS